MPGLHFAWHRGSGCLGAAAPVTGAAADEYNLNVVDCNASVTVARRSSISVSGQPPEANVNWFSVASPGPAGNFQFQPGEYQPSPRTDKQCLEM